MLKTMIRLKEKVDIGGFYELTAFLKRKADGYVPVKSEPFEDFEVEKFLSEADDSWLDVKVVCIFGVCGALRGIELTKLTTQHVREYGKLYLVDVSGTKNKKDRQFTITGSLYDIVKKYANLRPPNVDTDRFFLNYQNGKCVCQVIGKQKFSLMPRRIAAFLQLPNPDTYTGHSFRRSSASILANTGASIENVKNLGGWSSSKVAEGYIENSFAYKRRTGETMSSAITGANALFSKSSTSGTISNAQQPTGDGLSANGFLVSKPLSLCKKRKVETTTAPASDGILVKSQNSSTVSYAAVYETRKVETTSTSAAQSLADHESIEMDTHNIITASQGYATCADDDIEDSLLATLDFKHNEESRQPLQGPLPEILREMSFTHCTVTINFKKRMKNSHNTELIASGAAVT